MRQRLFSFERPVSLKDVYRMLKKTADATASRWDSTYTSPVSYYDGGALEALDDKLKGRIERGDLQLGFDLSGESLDEHHCTPGDPYFDRIRFGEVFAWKGGDATDRDFTRLSCYMNEIERAMRSSTKTNIIETPQVESD